MPWDYEVNQLTSAKMSKCICLRVDLAFDKFTDDKQEKLQLITNALCALLNTEGGQLRINMDYFDKDTIHDLIRKIEQRFKNIIGALACSEKIVQELVTPQKITFLVIAINDYLCTLSYNLFLPSTTATRAQTIEPNEPITAIEKILEGKQRARNRVPTQPGRHRREFKKDEQVGDDFLLNMNVVCKPLRDRNVKKEMTNKQSKFHSQVSALANDIGGYIYHGIKSGKVVGVPVCKSAIQGIISEVENALGRLIWGGDERPQRGREWDIYFEPVDDEGNSTVNSQTFVIVVYIAPYSGGVFVAEPESYHLVEDKVERMCFKTWKKELLRRRTLRQCNCIDEHVKSIAVSSSFSYSTLA